MKSKDDYELLLKLYSGRKFNDAYDVACRIGLSGNYIEWKNLNMHVFLKHARLSEAMATNSVETRFKYNLPIDWITNANSCYGKNRFDQDTE